MKAIQTLIVLLSWAALTAGAAQKSPSKNEDDVMLLDGPNFVLPSRVGLFQRSEVKTFDKSGRDVGIGYDLDHLIKGARDARRANKVASPLIASSNKRS